MTTTEVVSLANFANNNNNCCESTTNMKVDPEDVKQSSCIEAAAEQGLNNSPATSSSSSTASQLSPVLDGSSAFTVVSPKPKENEGKQMLQSPAILCYISFIFIEISSLVWLDTHELCFHL